MAIEHFETGVAEVRLLLGLRSEPGTPGHSSDKDNAVHRACVVLLVSHFESFLKSMAEEFIDLVGSGALESRRIPRGIRELHTLPQMTAILESSDVTQRGVLMKKLHPLMALWNDDAKPPKGTLSASVLSRQVTNAHSETIDRLFEYMGSRSRVCDGYLDVRDANGDLAPADIRYGLTDVIQCRNDIAHGDVSRKPTGADVARYLDFLVTLANRLQRKAEALITLLQP